MASALLDRLHVCLGRLEEDGARGAALNAREMLHAVKGLLQHARVPMPEAALRGVCRDIFSTRLALGELFLCTCQLARRHLSPPILDELQDAACTPNRVWIRLGMLRARLIEPGTQQPSTAELQQVYKEVVDIGLEERLEGLLAATVVEVCELLFECARRDAALLHPARLPLLLQLLICSRHDIVLHKVRSLITKMYRVSPRQDHADGQLMMQQMDGIVRAIEPSAKMRYLLMRDLLDANAHIPGFTGADAIPELLGVLVASKALGPSISECVVLLAKLHAYQLAEALPAGDDEGYLGTFLFPRLVKHLPVESAVILNRLLSKCTPSSDRETDTLQYISLYLAFTNSEESVPRLDLAVLKKGLLSRSEVVRTRSFLSLCKSVSAGTAYEQGLGTLVLQFLLDMQLSPSAESRQQTVSALRQICASHFSRLYRLLRDSASADREDGQGEEGEEEEEEKGAALLRVEAEQITGMWRAVVGLSVESLTSRGYFKKNELCLQVLCCIVSVWHQKLAVIASLRNLHAQLCERMQCIIAPLLEAPTLEKISSCILQNSYDSIRAAAEELVRALQYPDALPFKQDPDYLQNVVLPQLAERRAHFIDGAARMTALICDASPTHHASTTRLLTGRLYDEIERIGAGRAVSECLVQSDALGTMAALRLLVGRAEKADALLIIECCQRIGNILAEYVSQPAPEGFLVEDQSDEEDGDASISFSVMTFCWRATRESCVLMTTCLQRLGPTLSPEFLSANAQYLMRLLLKIRHPGAFMSISRPLRDLCQICYQSGSLEIQQIPLNVLKSAVDLSISQPEIQTTRRSAGLPVCIAAIVSASTDEAHRGYLLKFSIDSILGVLAGEEGELLGAGGLPRPQVVHSLNILRQLFRESTLANDVFPYVPVGFTLCFRAFRSPLWAIRNSGMMLFTALMNRTFGVRHGTDEFAPKDLVDARALHVRCDVLLDMVSEEIRAVTGTLREKTCRIESSVYPLLSFIQRVRFSSGGEARFETFYHSSFEFCLRCLESPIFKVRKMAARLLAHLAESHLLSALLAQRMQLLLQTWSTANQFHGALLALGEVMERRRGDGFGGEASVGDPLQKARERWQSLARPCPAIDQLLERVGRGGWGDGDGQGAECKGTISEAERVALVGQMRTEFNSGPISKSTISRMAMVPRDAFGVDEVREVYRVVCGRALHGEAIDALLPILMYAVLSGSCSLSPDILRLFEGFWTDYDLSGMYRMAVASHWDESQGVDAVLQRRIQYLVLTDDDPEIREFGAGRGFGACSSVPHTLRHLISNFYEDIRDLLPLLPGIQQQTVLDQSRQQLFEPEPLNVFKDLEWQSRFLPIPGK